jgi:hypothetical protein
MAGGACVIGRPPAAISGARKRYRERVLRVAAFTAGQQPDRLRGRLHGGTRAGSVHQPIAPLSLNFSTWDGFRQIWQSICLVIGSPAGT